MANIENAEYIVVRDDEGTDYYCPAQSRPGGRPAADDVPGDCVERDVTERYSGNLA